MIAEEHKAVFEYAGKLICLLPNEDRNHPLIRRLASAFGAAMNISTIDLGDAEQAKAMRETITFLQMSVKNPPFPPKEVKDFINRK